MVDRVIIAGGGTAGHVNPLIATAKLLANTGCEVKVLGTAEGLESKLVPLAGFELLVIPRVPLPRRLSLDLVKLPVQLRRTVKQTRAYMQEFRPDVVVGYGGYVSAPAYLAANSLKIPVVVHEQNVMPGFANKLGARIATGVGITFPNTPLHAHKGFTEVVGMPLRAEITSIAKKIRNQGRQAVRTEALAELGLDPQNKTLLVTGGSLGAVQINEGILNAAPELLKQKLNLLHLTGQGKDKPVRELVETIPSEFQERYCVIDYLHQMEIAYAAADLVVCRSGASTVAELSALGVASILVPFAVGNGEQAKNGRILVGAGAALMVNNSDFTSAWVTQNISPLFHDEQKIKLMEQSALEAMPADGDKRLVAIIERAHKQINQKAEKIRGKTFDKLRFGGSRLGSRIRREGSEQ